MVYDLLKLLDSMGEIRRSFSAFIFIQRIVSFVWRWSVKALSMPLLSNQVKFPVSMLMQWYLLTTIFQELLNISNADKTVTPMLINARKLLDIKVIDHVRIESKGRFCGLSESSNQEV